VTDKFNYEGDGSYQILQQICYLKHLNESQLAPIWKEVNKIKNNFEDSIDNRSNLAGNINREFLLTDTRDHIEALVSRYIMEWDSSVGNIISQYQTNTHNTPFAIQTVWVNFQKKHEFNPIHNHTGAYSFVIWLDIPYTVEEEMNHSPGYASNKPAAGCFEFVYPDMNGVGSLLLPIDKSFNGNLCIFKSNQKHLVYPFYTSEDYRITVAGNISFLTGPKE
jgi:hypothetical protein